LGWSFHTHGVEKSKYIFLKIISTILKALEKGYKIDLCYRIWKWTEDKWDSDLFKVFRLI